MMRENNARSSHDSSAQTIERGSNFMRELFIQIVSADEAALNSAM
jgi:hypothetical protein